MGSLGEYMPFGECMRRNSTSSRSDDATTGDGRDGRRTVGFADIRPDPATFSALSNVGTEGE
ncbi:hypothetical protein SAMN05216278_1134 [Halopelagius longus]|uniref:Uncharacterized protein n=1 Tax=Halopelagius longus TaxID=1236180 RepID=A0A1H0ZC27_9EURY|nr:hypothetical protein SAMN05216278_1134 [Halopelagius longus]